MDEIMDIGVICPCCGKKGTGEFCMHCGEIMKHQRLSLNTLIKSIPDIFFDVEYGLFYSIPHWRKRLFKLESSCYWRKDAERVMCVGNPCAL